MIDKKVVYMLCGQSGVGKTTLSEHFKDHFDVICVDKVRYKNIPLHIEKSTKPILLDIAMKVSTFIKANSEHYDIKPIFMMEPIEIIKERIKSRGGNMLSIEKRYNRMKSLSKRYGYFTGNTIEVENFLNELKESFRI